MMGEDVHHHGTSFPSCRELQLVEPKLLRCADGVQFDRKKRRAERLALQQSVGIDPDLNVSLL